MLLSGGFGIRHFRLSGLLQLCWTLILATATVSCTMSEKHVRRDIEHRYSASEPQFLRTLGVMLGPSLVPGNQITALQNGDEIFPAMLEAIRNAKETINFETYIYWSGDIGKQFAEAFAERARAGVKVHVILDWFGSLTSSLGYITLMKEAGVEVNKYHSLKWYSFHRLDFRTHRKLLIVDGRIGFTGGVGVGDEWSGHAQNPNHWRDSHYRVEGPVVAQMQAAFMDNWIKVTGEVLHGAEYFPAPTRAGQTLAQMFISSPSGGSESIQLMYLLAITAAEKSIYLSPVYFIPAIPIQRALIEALERGVKVKIIVSGEHVDSRMVKRASRSRWGPLLKAGAEIYEYEPTLYHSKLTIVDGAFVSVGSANFDSRSLRLNEEANMNIYDIGLARHLIDVFTRDLTESQLVTYERWRSRPLGQKLLDNVTSLVGSQL